VRVNSIRSRFALESSTKQHLHNEIGGQVRRPNLGPVAAISRRQGLFLNRLQVMQRPAVGQIPAPASNRVPPRSAQHSLERSPQLWKGERSRTSGYHIDSAVGAILGLNRIALVARTYFSVLGSPS
jgi:hypothetical protein